ncbi:ankyrin repeat-containing domain protein [Pterulicium gracile]|uniref:Ankyrin repeat-containing domain protein n=1 Tax=Pterulicium gracile TaxID=1884261 RepID=A0A5C3QLH0_9AGAR|nr:ankyrin repeat-containing domain protein [Pterula gracilis]
MSKPTTEDNDELLLSCRYGDLDDLKAYVDKFGADSLSEIRDDNGNTILHMTSANGHIDVLDYLLPLVDSNLLSVQNHARSTALHWAVLNQHLDTAKKLVGLQPGPGVNLIDIQNAKGRSPLTEAELAGWNEGAAWLVEKMNLNTGAEGEATAEDEQDVPDTKADVEVEIKDAEGRIARAKISDSG